jgi:ADP-heptose:LPS heptosyltransferase
VSGRRLLVYRALGLGDFLTAVPAYRALARAFPEHDLVLAAPEVLRPLAALTGAVDELLATAELATPAWRGDPPDVVVNLHGKGPESHRLLAPLGSRRLVAFGCTAAGVDGPAWRPDEHEVLRWCRLLTESGVPADPGDLDLAQPSAPAPVGGATVVHPGAADPARRWPPERFAALARVLEQDGHRVVVTGVAAERELAEAVAAGAGLPPDRVLAGRVDLAGLAGVVADARLVVCGDTGVAHLATAYRTPSVLLFGPMAPALWGPPPGRPQHRVVWSPPRPEDDGVPHPSLLRIGVAQVLDAVAALPQTAVGERDEELGEGLGIGVRGAVR